MIEAQLQAVSYPGNSGGPAITREREQGKNEKEEVFHKQEVDWDLEKLAIRKGPKQKDFSYSPKKGYKLRFAHLLVCRSKDCVYIQRTS